MKHGELRAFVHNVADSLASGIGLLIGVYGTDVFGEARLSHDGSLTVDFLNGTIVEGGASKSLAAAVSLYREALAKLISDAGGSISALNEAKVRFWSDRMDCHFAVTIEDSAGRRSTTEYAGMPGKRVRTMDRLGRPRPTRAYVEAIEACKAEWDLARGHHQGQRSRKGPHQQAGHKTAPDQPSEHQIVACNAGAIHTRPKPLMS